MTVSNRRLLTGILVFALALRVGVAFAWQPAPTGDAEDYHRLATGLAAGRGYVDTRGQPTAWRPPGYPAFLAGVYVVVGDAPAAVGLIQAAVGTASVAAVFAVTAPVLGATAGLVAAALVAVDVAQLSLTAQRLSEGLFTLLLLLLVLSSLRLRARLLAAASPWGWAAVAGVLGGIATLTRGLFVGYPLVLAAALAADGGGTAARSGRRRAGAAALLLLTAYVLTLLPWTLRNVTAVGAPVPVATQGGITLYSSWFPPDGTVFGLLSQDEVTAGAIGLTEPEQSRYFTQATLRRLGEGPARIPRLLVLKALYLAVPLDWEVLPAYGSVNPTYVVVAFWAGLFLTALGAGRRRRAWPLWLPLVYLAGMALVFYGSPRLRAPVDPLLATLAAGAMVELARRRGRRTAASAVAASAAGAVALAALAGPLKALALSALRRAGMWRR